MHFLQYLIVKIVIVQFKVHSLCILLVHNLSLSEYLGETDNQSKKAK